MDRMFLCRDMDYSRQVALELLKPSKRELEHGLELHADALVCEAYGFAPRGPVPDDKVQGAYDVRSFANKFEQQMNCLYMEDPALRAQCLRAWRYAGVNCVFLNAGIESMVPLELIKRLARYTHVCDLYPGIYRRVVWPEQVLELPKDGRIGLGFTTCGVPLVHELAPMEESLYLLTVFFQLGVRMMHLTYNRRNLLGDGCAEKADAGLSGFGRDVIREMNKVGIIVDVAHCGQRTSLEAAECSELPVTASHTAVGALTKHIRAKSDEVIRAIARRGGYVGICTLPKFLQGEGNIRTFLDHVDYVAGNFGVDHVAIATDNAYFCGEPFHWGPKFKVHRRFEAYWPENPAPFEVTDEMEESLNWTNWPLFTVGLVQRGYSDDDIRKILSGNFMRVFTKAVEHIRRDPKD